MANKRTLNQADADYLKKEISKEVTKTVVPEVTKALIPRLKTIVTLVISTALTEQEEKYEKKLDDFKSEFFNRIDPILKEVKTKREERPIIAKKLANHSDRIEKLEKIHPKGKHNFATS